MFFTCVKGKQWSDRGDIESGDFDIGNFTMDAQWHDLDLSSIVGLGQKLVVLKGDLRATAGGIICSLRTNGNTNAINVFTITSQVANSIFNVDMFVYTDPNGIVEYNVSTTDYNLINMTIRGWFE